MNKRWEIAIVGGTGGMGQLFAKELKSHAEIIIISRSLEKAEAISQKLGVRSGRLQDCRTADIIIISVPIENTYETCQALFQIVKPGSLIIDIAAVKTPLEKIKAELPAHLSYISMHPLFGPEGTFRNFNVLLIPIKEDHWLPKIQELLKKLGATSAITTPEEHDLMMSKIQVAHHFMYLALAAYLSDTQIAPHFFTRSFKETLKNFESIEKNLSVILEIQHTNPYAESTREEISSLIQDLIALKQATKIKELLDKVERFKRTYFLKKSNK